MDLTRGKLYRLIFILFATILFSACSDSEAPVEKSRVSDKQTESAGTTSPDTAIMPSAKPSALVELENDVIYQEEIYKNWPYTEAPQVIAETPVAGMSEQDAPIQQQQTVPAMAGEKMAVAKQEMEAQVVPAVEAVTEQVKEVMPAATKTHTINAEARAFNPDIIYIQPGDTVGWINMTSHNTVSVEGLIPEGAKHWRGQLGENLKITLDVEGVHAYVCEPHIGFGMVGVIVVGQPGNLDEVKQYASENLKGPYRRIIGKLIKVTVQ